MQRERRRFPRVAEPLEAQYRIDGDFTSSWKGMTVINLSAGGIRFRSPESISPGASLQLKIKLPGVPQPLELRGAAVWSAMQAPEVIETGVEFLDLTLKQQAQIDQLVSFLRTRL